MFSFVSFSLILNLAMMVFTRLLLTFVSETDFSVLQDRVDIKEKLTIQCRVHS